MCVKKVNEYTLLLITESEAAGTGLSWFSFNMCILKGIWFWLNPFHPVYKLLLCFHNPERKKEDAEKPLRADTYCSFFSDTAVTKWQGV